MDSDFCRREKGVVEANLNEIPAVIPETEPIDGGNRVGRDGAGEGSSNALLPAKSAQATVGGCFQKDRQTTA
jgi:hypothetical protein